MLHAGDICPALPRPQPQGLYPWKGRNKVLYVSRKGVVVPGLQTLSWARVLDVLELELGRA